jgi:hypothetical protein
MPADGTNGLGFPALNRVHESESRQRGGQNVGKRNGTRTTPLQGIDREFFTTAAATKPSKGRRMARTKSGCTASIKAVIALVLRAMSTGAIQERTLVNISRKRRPRNSLEKVTASRHLAMLRTRRQRAESKGELNHPSTGNRVRSTRIRADYGPPDACYSRQSAQSSSEQWSCVRRRDNRCAWFQNAGITPKDLEIWIISVLRVGRLQLKRHQQLKQPQDLSRKRRSGPQCA